MEHIRYYILYKPYLMLSQFSPEAGGKPTLADLNYHFPKDVYPVGRLDAESEGLLLLTNDKQLNHLLLEPSYGHERTYLVQVDGEITEDACSELKKGMEIKLNDRIHKTLPAQADKIKPPSWLRERVPPVRFRKNIPTSWIRLTLTEGKNHQVRKMTAKTGFPTLRLIRESMGKLNVEGLVPGTVKELKKEDVYSLLDI
ncbi:MAG TPA: pseudouridine synthase [Bacteroidia bacterium]|jgi:23S rRNA pseudouridine2457 synthase|nr:pseudouridine synthase [Bacteroidia bacterium]